MDHKFKLNVAQIEPRVKVVKHFDYIGHLLFSERQLRGLSLFQVSKDLNISSYILKDIEKGNLSAPPGYSYMLGFVRTYAFYLGLNGRDFLDVLPAADSYLFENERPLVVPPSARHLPGKYTVAIATSIFVILCFYPFFKGENKPSAHALKLDGVILDKSKQSFYKPKNSSKLVEASQMTLTPDNDHKIILCFRGPSWVSLADERGNILKQGILKEGDKITLPSNFKGKMHTGDAGNIYISYKNKNSKFLGEPGEVIQNFPVDLKNILQNHSNLANN